MDCSKFTSLLSNRSTNCCRPHVFMASRTQLLLSESEIDAFLMLALPYLLELSEFNARILGIQLSTFVLLIIDDVIFFLKKYKIKYIIF